METLFNALIVSKRKEKKKRKKEGSPLLDNESQPLTDGAPGTETVRPSAGRWRSSTYHLLTKSELLDKARAEVGQVVDGSGRPPSWTALEKLPYLGAVIHEGLRLSYGLATRVPTGEDLVYRGDWTPEGSRSPTRLEYVIPRGYAIGMSAVIAHHDESLYPDSHDFVPERWLDENGRHRKELDRALLAFSKGSRGCPGINLAYCELHLLLGLLIVRVFPRMKLH
ncbi:cytochrome P450 [Colletotrichum falcatum]|nr:cytochrome P450 [Colletotrichum falcatum]